MDGGGGEGGGGGGVEADIESRLYVYTDPLYYNNDGVTRGHGGEKGRQGREMKSGTTTRT